MKTNKPSAARQAFDAVSAAIEKAEDAIKVAKNNLAVPGTTVMMEQGRHGEYESADYKCSVCQAEKRNARDKEWKFCPYCGSEIVRWQDNPPWQAGERRTIKVG